MQHHVTIWYTLVVAFVLTAATGDVRWRKIPRAFTAAGFAAGLLFHLVYGGITSAALGAFLAFAVSLTLFQLGAIGGGDVKLIVALGAMHGLKQWLFAMEVAVLTAGAIALMQAIQRRVLWQTIRNIGESLRWMATSGVRTHPAINVNNPAMLRAPFGVSAAFGTVIAVLASWITYS
jgi:prepilin peptidase CpaA